MTGDEPPKEESADTSKRFSAREEEFDGANDEALAIKLALLAEEHADLDAAIRALESQAHHDRLSVARLKKKKLQIKDKMQAIRDQMTPDIIA
ncbi:MAG: DUF465 domain-containing protein [Alphaproteobacteria bacterium]|nr:DUF465 domain-containing protein [Alphaproteobacteria bacterium]